MNIVVLLRLIPLKVRDHLLPLLLHPQLDHLTIVRYSDAELEHPKASQVTFAESEIQADGTTTKIRPWLRVRNVLLVFWHGLLTVRRENPDVVYGIFMNTYGTQAWVISKLLRKRSMISLIGSDFNRDVMELPLKGWWRWMLRHTDVVTVFDEGARQKLLALGFDPQKVFVMPHAVDMEHIKRRESVPQDIDVIYLGNFWPLKEIDRVLEAWVHVLAVKPDAKLALVGDGTYTATLRDKAQALGILDKILMPGWAHDVSAWYSRAKIFVNLSGHEGVPMAMLEAMACGLVPVVTSVGGVPSVVEHASNGFLVDHPADPVLVSQHILALLQDTETYVAMQVQALTVREQHSYEAVAEWWQSILDYFKELE